MTQVTRSAPLLSDTGRPGAPTMGGADWITLVGLSMLWGGSFFFYKIMAASIPPITVVLGRALIAAIVLHLILSYRGERFAFPPSSWLQLAVLAILTNVFPFVCFAWSEHYISSGLASVLNATTPIFAVLLAHLYRFEHLRPGRLAGVLCGAAGTLVVVGPGLSSGSNAGLGGEMACLAASICYAFGGIYARRFAGKSPLQVTAGQTSASAIILLPVSCLIDRPWQLPMPGAAAWSALFGIAILSTVIAYVIYFRLLARAGPTNTSLVTLLVPVSALLLGAIILGEPIYPSALVGMGLIAAGLAAIDGRMLALFTAYLRRSRIP